MHELGRNLSIFFLVTRSCRSTYIYSCQQIGWRQQENILGLSTLLWFTTVSVSRYFNLQSKPKWYEKVEVSIVSLNNGSVLWFLYKYHLKNFTQPGIVFKSLDSYVLIIIISEALVGKFLKNLQHLMEK